jgi:hypothetical protein
MFDDIQDAFDAFESFMFKRFDRKIDEFDIYKRKKLGRYFSELDTWFAIWHEAQKENQLPKL